VDWVTPHDDGALIRVWVVPGASRSELGGLHGDAVRIRVAAPAEGGRANAAVVDLMAAATGADVELVRGAGSRAKTLLVRGRSPAEVAGLLGLEPTRRDPPSSV
jgi:hypothetical protein